METSELSSYRLTPNANNFRLLPRCAHLALEHLQEVDEGVDGVHLGRELRGLHVDVHGRQGALQSRAQRQQPRVEGAAGGVAEASAHGPQVPGDLLQRGYAVGAG